MRRIELENGTVLILTVKDDVPLVGAHDRDVHALLGRAFIQLADLQVLGAEAQHHTVDGRENLSQCQIMLGAGKPSG